MSPAIRWCAVVLAVPLTACLHLPMMGGMALGIGMAGHRRGASACEREARAMEAHLRRVDTITPGHVRRLEALLDACEPPPSDASPSADTVRVTAGALRDDLSQLRRRSPSELGAFMPEHNARIRAFLSLQRAPRRITRTKRAKPRAAVVGLDVDPVMVELASRKVVSLYRSRKGD